MNGRVTSDKATAGGGGWHLTPKWLAAGAGVLALVFLLGYVPSCVSERGAQERNARLSGRLQLAELHSHLGMMSYEANRNNFANAAQFSTKFFDGLPEAIADIQEATLKEKLQSFGARRDEITANLALADASVKDKLAQMYAEFYPLVTAPPGGQD